MIWAVLDANVLVSAVLNERGAPGKILQAWHAEQFGLLMSEVILKETARVLRYPKIVRRHGWTESQIAEFIRHLQGLAMVTPGKLVFSAVTQDPSDNRYLECAVEGEADCIVSGDRHLLSLGEFRGIEIVRPVEFLAVLR